MNVPSSSLLWSGIGLLLAGYMLWPRPVADTLQSVIDQPVGAAQDSSNSRGLSLWFSEPNPTVVRYMRLHPNQVKVLKQRVSLPIERTVKSAVALFASGQQLILEDTQYTVNGAREGSKITLDPAEEIMAEIELDTQGPLNPLGIYDKIRGVLVMVE